MNLFELNQLKIKHTCRKKQVEFSAIQNGRGANASQTILPGLSKEKENRGDLS